MINVEVFDYDEEGYRRWRAAHNWGWILNWTQSRTPWYPMIHRVGCPIMTTEATNHHTAIYKKACCVNEDLLRLWAKVNNLGEREGVMRECGHCMGVFPRVDMAFR
jgi:hypothetical protein